MFCFFFMQISSLRVKILHSIRESNAESKLFLIFVKRLKILLNLFKSKNLLKINKRAKLNARRPTPLM